MTMQGWLAASFGFVFVLLLLATALALIFGPRREVQPEAMWLLRVAMSLAFGAVVPGMLEVGLDLPGLAVRGTAGFALFVLVYRVNPPTLLGDSMRQEVKGDNAKAIQTRGNNTKIDVS
jgi:hypothetical protein